MLDKQKSSDATCWKAEKALTPRGGYSEEALTPHAEEVVTSRVEYAQEVVAVQLLLKNKK